MTTILVDGQTLSFTDIKQQTITTTLPETPLATLLYWFIHPSGQADYSPQLDREEIFVAAGVGGTTVASNYGYSTTSGSSSDTSSTTEDDSHQTSSISSTSSLAATQASTPLTTTNSDSAGSQSSGAGFSVASTSSIPSTSAANASGSGTIAPSGVAASTGQSASTAEATVHKNSDLSAGATAGVAIGCFIAGAAIAAILAFFLLRRRRQPHRDYAPAAGYELKEHSSMTPDTPIIKGASVAVASLPPASAAAIIEDALPRPADNDTLRAAIAGLRTQISNHVLSFYRTNPSQEQVPLEALSGVLVGSGSPPENMQALLRDHRTRAAAMRFLLAWAATSRMDARGGQTATFLPDEVVSLRDHILGNETDDEARGAFLSKWRTITAYLLNPDFEHSDDSGRGGKVDDAVAGVDSAIKTYAKGDTNERLRNLEEVMRRAERLAFMLFAQPGEFAFDWARAEQGIVVFPGLVQTTEENGRMLASEHVVLERDVVRV